MTQTATIPNPQTPAPLWRWLLPPVLAAGFAGMLGAALLNPARNIPEGGPLINKPAPTFTLESLDGAPVRLASLQGRPVVLNFWASWCGPCREEAPLLRDLSERRGAGQGLAVIGVLFQETNEQHARDFIREYALAYPALRDPGIKTGINSGVSGISETFFIDREGVIRDKASGGLNRERLNAGLAKIGVKGL